MIMSYLCHSPRSICSGLLIFFLGGEGGLSFVVAVVFSELF